MFNKKFRLFSLSLVAVWIVLIVRNVDIPIYFGTDCEFVGWKRILTYQNLSAAFGLIMLFFSLDSWIKLKHILTGSPSMLKTKITAVEDRSSDYVNHSTTVVTIFGAIFTSSINSFRDILVFAILMAVIAICFFRSNLYYCNPILAFFHFRLYSVQTESGKLTDKDVVIYYGELKKDTMVTTYHVADNVYYLL